MGEIERLQPEECGPHDVASEAELNREGIKHAHAELRRLRERIEKGLVMYLHDNGRVTSKPWIIGIDGKQMIGRPGRLVVEED
jgi:hypothetical protein